MHDVLLATNWLQFAPLFYAVAGLLVVLSTAWGRNSVSKLFKGNSIAQVTQASADQIATVQAAYEVVTQELERQKHDYEIQISAMKDTIDAQKSRIEALEGLASNKQEIEALTQVVANNHNAILGKLNELHSAVRTHDS